MKGAKKNIYSVESSRELIEKDVLQLHIPRYASMRKDVLGCSQEMDFFLWPRGDLLCIRCFVFSRWKDQLDEPFRLVQADFMFFASDYEVQLRQLTATTDVEEIEADSNQNDVPKSKAAQGSTTRTGQMTKKPGTTLRSGRNLMLANAEQSLFLFVNRIQTDQSKAAIFKLISICLSLPQDQLMCWGMGSVEEILQPFMA